MTALILAVAIALSCFYFLSFAAGATDIGRYTVNIPEDKMLPVRKSASTSAEKIGNFYAGDSVEIVEVKGAWAKTVIGGQIGWFMHKYAEKQKEYECAELIADIRAYSNNSSVDFKKLKNDGVKGVILRFGLSANEAAVIAVDSKFSDYYDAAKAEGLKVGLYFESMSLSKAGNYKECAWIKAELEKADINAELPVFYLPKNSEQKKLTSSENTDNIKSFADSVKSAGYTAGVYLPYDWTSKNVDFDSLNGVARWIADYGDYCNFSKNFDIWQFSNNFNTEASADAVGFSYMFNSVAIEPTVSITAPNSTEPEIPSDITDASDEKTTNIDTEQKKHVQGEFVITKQPTCTGCGTESAYCVDCGKLMHTRSISPAGHKDSMWTVEKAPLADADGVAVRYCDICGLKTKEHVLDAKGSSHIHLYGDWEYVDSGSAILNSARGEEGTTSAESINNGGKIYACTVDSEKILKCTECGKITDRYAGIPNNHAAADDKKISQADCENDGHEMTYCKDCGFVIEDIITVSNGHTVKNWDMTKEPTATETGLRSGVCEICKKQITEILPMYDIVKGDVDGNGKVTSNDARAVLRHALNLDLIESEEALLRADMNEDGKINTSDARAILRRALKLD